MKILEPEKLRLMEASFVAGSGIRATARNVGLSPDTVRKYYAMRPPTNCPCGKPMTHLGWCASRVARSPGRQASLAKITTIKEDTRRKWLAQQNVATARARYSEVLAKLSAGWARQSTMRENALIGPVELIKRVRVAVRHRCVSQVFDDVVQDVLLELVNGTLEAEGLDRSPAVARIVNRNYQLLLPRSNCSLDDTFGDRLPSTTPLFNEAIVTKH